MVSRIKLITLTMALAFTGSVIAQEPITPIEPVKDINLAKVELGKKLYFDPRLSKSGFIVELTYPYFHDGLARKTYRRL